MAVHVFIDNSSIFSGARRTAAKLEHTGPLLGVRVYYQNLSTILEGSRPDVATRVMAGSVPPGDDDLWGYSRHAGYDTDLLKKVDYGDGDFGEQGVDELLHSSHRPPP